VKEIMLDRLKNLETNVNELNKIKENLSINDLKKDKTKEWALRYGLLETIQILIDISCHLVSKYNLGNPETYTDCIELLLNHKYINEKLSKKIISMIGLRNLLVHEYSIIDVSKLWQFLEDLNSFKEFSMDIKEYL